VKYQTDSIDFATDYRLVCGDIYPFDIWLRQSSGKRKRNRENVIFAGALINYIAGFALRRARRLAAQFDMAARSPREVQTALLRRVMERQKGTQFGRDHRFQEIRNVGDFRRNVPITRYEDYEPYIAQLRRGKLEALVSEPVRMFAMTSGTTAARKYIPVTPQYLKDYRRGWTIWGIRALEDHPSMFIRPIFQMTSDWEEFRTEAGIPCGSISGLTAKMQSWLVRRHYCVPPDCSKIKDAQAKYYTALRLSLPGPVGMLVFANPSTGVQLGRLCDKEKEALIRDIRDGALSNHGEVPREVQAAIAARIRRPNPGRARELEEIVRRTGALYPKDCWPELSLVATWTGGSAATYIRQLRHYYGNVSTRDLGLLASEGRMSIPLADGLPQGVLDITSHFFEFVPEREIDSPQPTVLQADELIAGEAYFVLLTTAFGLCRYNISDLVRVTGFHHATPFIEFLNKGAHIANITGEKLSEFQVVRAVEEAQRELLQTLTAYTVAPCWDNETPYYGLFVERGELGPMKSAKEFASLVDEKLRALNIEYNEKRGSGRLDIMRVLVVPPGTGAEWDRTRMILTGSTAEQYKHPCLVSDPAFRDQMPVDGELRPQPEPAPSVS
jgi:hypothetical protein